MVQMQYVCVLLAAMCGVDGFVVPSVVRVPSLKAVGVAPSVRSVAKRVGVVVGSTAEGLQQATPSGRELAEKLKNVNVYLVGLMGSGKSAVGDRVSRALGSYTFVDTDETIETATGSSVSEIFEKDGEAGFRAVEEQVLTSVAAYVRLVIATGGGIVTVPGNWASLRTGIVVWLDTPVDVLAERLSSDEERAKRPLLGTKEELQAKLGQMLAARESLYAQSDVRVALSGDEAVAQVADKVVDDVLAFIIANPPKTEENSTPPQ